MPAKRHAGTPASGNPPSRVLDDAKTLRDAPSLPVARTCSHPPLAPVVGPSVRVRGRPGAQTRAQKNGKCPLTDLGNHPGVWHPGAWSLDAGGSPPRATQPCRRADIAPLLGFTPGGEPRTGVGRAPPLGDRARHGSLRLPPCGGLDQRTLARFFLASAPLFALSAALNQVRGRMLRPPGDRTRRVREGGGGRGGAGCAHARAPRPRPAARAHAELGQMAARLAAGAPRARLAADLAVLARRGGAGVPCGAPGDNRWEGRGVARAALRAATGQPRGLHRRPAPRSVRRAARAAPRSPRQSRRPRPRCLWDLLLAGCSRAGGAGRLQCGQP